MKSRQIRRAISYRRPDDPTPRTMTTLCGLINPYDAARQLESEGYAAEIVTYLDIWRNSRMLSREIMRERQTS